MTDFIHTLRLPSPPICEKEIVRYLGMKEADEPTSALLDSCLAKLEGKLDYRVCYGEFPVSVSEDTCDFGYFSFSSAALARLLKDSERAVLFAATVGIEPDRFVAKYGKLAPSEALMYQAIGAERIESLCDAFCQYLSEEMECGFTPRFSPGYGDFSLAEQKTFFSVLDPAKRIGVTLSDRFLMVPTKSVTAVMGITKEKTRERNKCATCSKKDCAYRGES